MVFAASLFTCVMTLDRRAELGEFLRSRRARLGPHEVGLVDHGARRRVPGLRREELALLAGVTCWLSTTTASVGRVLVPDAVRPPFYGGRSGVYAGHL
ncbi:hypothetical protein NS506_03490 [Nocardia seriolae]|uniref:Uncharacterized protein n=2 Tax=Nocardia seriolae TaxID=37332 RepID=A0ABC8AUQ0_9NOCA|nr:hypothetical protein NS506_03490 [Nocardia seriolae]BEK87142.1 hypothetical protein NSERKGN1266_30930 [Nocardia seriolae]GEM27068.1 hypothetical protein NS2_53070 [Nocardia seriolae NBRC 15557]